MVEAQAEENGLEGCLLGRSAGPARPVRLIRTSLNLSSCAWTVWQSNVQLQQGNSLPFTNLSQGTSQLDMQRQQLQCKVGGGSPAAHFLAESSKCTPHVGAHVTRGLIGDLDASLQDRLWHNLGLRRSIDGLSREEASEVCVSSLSSNLQLALQVGDPALHEMHIVQEHPAALLGVLVQDCLCRPFLTLRVTMHFIVIVILPGVLCL